MSTTLTRVSSEARVSGAPGVPLVLAASCVAAALAAIILVTRAAAWSVPGLGNQPVDLAVALTFPVMGALVLLGRRGSRRLGWLLILTGAAGATSSLAAALAGSATAVDATARAAVAVQAFAWVPGFLPVLTLVPLLYPDGRLPSRRWLPVAVASVVGIALLTVSVGLYPEPFEGRVVVEKPFASPGAAALLAPVAAVLLVPAVLASLASLLTRLRGATGMVRRQVAVLLVAFAVLVVDVLLQAILPADLRGPTQAVAVALLPVAIGVAITRHRLFDLDLAICRALVVVSLLLCLAGAFVTIFLLLEGLLRDRTELAGAVAGTVTGLLVQPLASRLTAGADRMLYGDRSDPYTVLTRLTTGLREGLQPDEVATVICETVLSSLRLTSVALSLVTAAGPRPPVVAGQPTGPASEVELRHRGNVVGRLTVTPRAGERSLPARDGALLEAIADHVAPVVSSARVLEELRRSREALVVAREEERRRLRHDLHDGVGAALAGVRLQLESARARVEDPLTGRLLDSAAAGVAEAVRDVRAVTDDLRPAALDELGLAASLRGLGERLATPERSVTVKVSELPELPAAVEVACFRVAAEALANAVRHSGGTRIEVEVRVDGRFLELGVNDDGRGIDGEAPRQGVGLASMRQRVDELGGDLLVESAAGGTTMTARLPLELV